MKKWLMIIVAAVLWSGTASGRQAETVAVGRFSAMEPGAPVAGWEAMTFPNIESHTRYALVEVDGKTVLRAESDASASGMVKRIDVDPGQYPLIAWEWRVANVLAKGDVTSKAGDDYAARIYITFDEASERISFLQRTKRAAIKMLYGMSPPSAAIAYIWGNRAAMESIHPNAYTDRCRMIVVESGPVHLNRWRRYQRNIADDFRRAFGYDPPRITGIAVMTDTDNTAESATAWYGDILLERETAD
ncbi:MAG TPA: DUF3047 domain-containing protein [Desulfosarcina sp.]|nr:DUF3047 domain-containing protein [Desulfosarcina sp.]